MVVSVIVSTYNSSSFIIETLESVYNQSWQEIELIVTDDCSCDNTIDICRQWLRDRGARFKRIQLVTSDLNTGIPGNANRGLQAATGAWIKFLGADDTLLPDCLKDNVGFVQENRDIRILFSRVDNYKEVFLKESYLSTDPDGQITPDSIVWPERTAKSQYRMLLVADRIHFAPSVFIQRDTLVTLGGFDERFRRMEDYPLWLNVTKSGNKLYFMDKITVNYRRHSAAINNTGLEYLINPNYFRNELFRRIYIYPNLPTDICLLQQFAWFLSQPFRWKILNRDTMMNRLLYSLLTVYINPFRYYIWFKKRLNRELQNNEFYV